MIDLNTIAWILSLVACGIGGWKIGSKDVINGIALLAIGFSLTFLSVSIDDLKKDIDLITKGKIYENPELLEGL